MDLLIIYATTDGFTQKVASFVRSIVQNQGSDVVMQNVKDARISPLSFDGVVVAGSVHLHSYQDELSAYITEHHQQLNAKKTVFISVSLTAEDHSSTVWDDLDEITIEFLNKTRWNPLRVIQIAGALRYTQYNFIKKMYMKRIAHKAGRDLDTHQDYEYTDWKALEQFINEYLIELKHDYFPKPV